MSSFPHAPPSTASPSNPIQYSNNPQHPYIPSSHAIATSPLNSAPGHVQAGNIARENHVTRTDKNGRSGEDVVEGDGQEGRKKRARTIASQACDSCRSRKIRCEFGEGGSGGERRCRGCQDVQLPCTFDLPVKRRGPLSKAAKAAQAATSPAASPMSDITSPKGPVPDGQTVTRQSEPRTPFQASLHTPEAVSNNVQLPPIHGYSPNLFHLRYPQQSPILASDEEPTSQICSRELFDEIMQDYVDLLYPLVPLVHIPSFKNDLRNRREVYDKPFLAFVISICAAVVAHMPSRFYHYRSRSPPLRFTTRRAMVDFCQEKIYSMRKADWYDEMSFTKFATSYMLVCSAVHMGHNKNRAKMLNVEASEQAVLLKFHSPSVNDGFDCIEMQLRKKAFWLCFFGFVHERITWNSNEYIAVYTEPMLESFSTLDVLLPREVDDEYITPSRYYSQPQHKTSLTVGFNANCRIFWAAVSSRANKVLTSTLQNAPIQEQLTSLRERLQRVKHALDFIIDVQPQLASWSATSPLPAGTADQVLDNQWESIRANVHVSTLWLQSMLFDQIVGLTDRTSTTDSAAIISNRSLWNEREDICRQLLCILYNISAQNLEPNGNVLVNKIRAVATTLLDCPFSQQGDIARRAHTYITNFAELLSRIDLTNDSSHSTAPTTISAPLPFHAGSASERPDINHIVNQPTATFPGDNRMGIVMGENGVRVGEHAGVGDVEEMERSTQQFWEDLDRYSRRGIGDFSVLGE